MKTKLNSLLRALLRDDTLSGIKRIRTETTKNKNNKNNNDSNNSKNESNYSKENKSMTDQEPEKAKTAEVDAEAPAVKDWTCARAPPVTASLYDEAIPMLDMSTLVYVFSNVIEERLQGNLDLVIPDDFPIKDLSRFLTQSIDFTKENAEKGMSFHLMDILIEKNFEELTRVFGHSDHAMIVRGLRQRQASCVGEKRIFLTHHRYLQWKHACVYSIVKDTISKRIIVSFRGSVTSLTANRDWLTNFTVLSAELWTPKKIAHKMEGKLKERILVHKGFHDYLFDNDKMKFGKQRYDMILKDIENIIEADYSVYVTGHSLGGALATMFSMKLAGSGKKYDIIPRPITCITYAAPHSGTSGYRAAIEQLEQEGYLRMLRVHNDEDIVPAGLGALLFRPRQQKQAGINLRLFNDGGYILEHSSRANFMTFLRSTIFKPIWRLTYWHSLSVSKERIEKKEEKWKGLKLDDLYEDKAVVSPAFIAGKTK